ncbi:hypothetical protein L484_004216 [Morus notabilis]|uniref:High mobility group B protein 6 n=1 Tax=Morus notabilis TaxID=981085 RepID=W9R614_9ROSA|nr:high mobility group B protein 13 isoform X2 [Morus notabilis]EXB74397.1 hypothetical protein L484_004216 [Morus notabilis]
MLTAKYPVTGDQKLRPKSARKPLQPKNIPANPVVVFDFAKTAKPDQECVKISLLSNKENQPAFSSPAKIESFDTSLAEELSAIKKKLERLKADREKTEKMLRERDMILDLQTKEIESRGEIQKKLEIEVDRLYRLNQLHSQSLRFSPIRSLREKERAKKGTESESQESKSKDREDSVCQSSPPELISSASSEIISETK